MISVRSFGRRARVCLAAGALTTFSVQITAQSGSQLPSGGQVVAGQVEINAGDHRLDLIQRSDRAVVNWQSFDIGARDIVMLTQPGIDSAMLARVVGNVTSSLQGQLRANGRLFLINPNGVVIGRDGIIDTNAFLATTLDVSDREFMAGGPMTLKGNSAATVVNLGSVTARGGNAALLAHAVINRGRISAPAGTALLIAGTEVYMASLDAPDLLVKANLASSGESTGVDNSGVIDAARAQLQAANGNIYNLAVNQSGVVRATGVDRSNGRIVLTATGGTVGVSGELRARNANGSGGEILVGGDYQGRNADVANASRTVVTDTAVIDANATAATGDGGRVIVWADQGTRMLGNISAMGGAEGGNGGFAEVSGQHVLDFRPSTEVNLSAAAGERGTLLLDPDALRITSSADANTTSTAGNPFIFGASSEPADLNATTLANQLNSSNVRLDTSSSSGDVTFNANVTWTSNNTLTVRSGNNINVNSNLTGGATSTIDLRPGKVGTGGTTTTGNITQASGSTIKAGTLSFGLNPNASVAGTFVNPDKMGAATFSGVLDVSTLALDLTKNIQSVSATNSGNKIGTFQTSGSPGDILGTLNVVDGSGNLDVKLVGLPDSAASAVTIVTPGTLTLLTGTSYGLGGAGTITLASTSAAFVNNAGSSAIQTNQANGNKFLIYTSTAGATVKGGLTGTDVSNKSYSANPPSDFSGDSISRFLFAGLANLTYTAENQTRQYGAADPTFTYTVSGLASGDTLSDWVSGTPSFTTTATQSSGVGSYTINIGQGSLSSTRYQFQFQSGTLTVTKAPLTVRVNNASRIFHDTNPAFSVSASGLRNSDTVSGSLSSLVFSTSADQFSTVGDYSVTATGTSANYSLTFEPGTLTINRAPATVFAPNYTGVYGDSHQLGRPTATGFHFDDLVDAFSLSSSLTERSGVGTYTITPVRTGFDIRSTTLLNNYAVSFVNGTATIAPRPLTVTASSVTRRYGDPLAIFTYSVSGLAPGDDASVVSGVSVTSAVQGGIATVPGTYPITFASPGTAGANYLLTRVNGVYTVNRLPVVITGGTLKVAEGFIPVRFPATMTPLPIGAPQIAIGASSDVTRTSTVGTYQILPFLQNDTLQIHQLYDISIVPGSLEVVKPTTISTSDLFNGKTVTNVVYDPALYDTTLTSTVVVGLDTSRDLNLVDYDAVKANEGIAATLVEPKPGSGGGGHSNPYTLPPLNVDDLASVVDDPGFWESFDLFMSEGDPQNYSEEDQIVFGLFKIKSADGKRYVTSALLKEWITTGHTQDWISGIGVLLGNYINEVVVGDGTPPITPAIQKIMNRLVGNINKQRDQVAQTATKNYDEWANDYRRREGVGAFNLQIMPDFVTGAKKTYIASILQVEGAGDVVVGQHGTTGAVVSQALDAGTRYIYPKRAKSINRLANKSVMSSEGVTKWSQVSEAGKARARQLTEKIAKTAKKASNRMNSAAGGAIEVMVAIGFIAGEEVSDSQANLEKYQEALRRSENPVSDLASYDWSDEQNAAEVQVAFGSVLAELLRTK